MSQTFPTLIFLFYLIVLSLIWVVVSSFYFSKDLPIR